MNQLLYLQERCCGQIFVSSSSFVFVNCISANDQCRVEINIQGMRLQNFVSKRMSISTSHICDIRCGEEITCQSYNYNRKKEICELNNRTKEARPESFRSAPGWFYIRRLNGRGMYSSDLVKWPCLFAR